MNYFQPTKVQCLCKNGVFNPLCPLHSKKQTSKWDLHFRRVSKRLHTDSKIGQTQFLGSHLAQLQVATFGGIEMNKTVDDLESIMKAKDNEILQITSHLKDVLKSGGTIDPAWMKDWTALNKRYFVAKQAARKYLDGNQKGYGIPTPYYNAVLKSIQASYPDAHHISPGDLADLFNRMPFAMKALPQPDPSFDKVYTALDTATVYMPTPIKAAIATVTPNLVPQTKDAGSYDAAKKQMEAAGDWISHNLTMIAVIAGGVAVVAVASKMPSGGGAFGGFGRRRVRR